MKYKILLSIEVDGSDFDPAPENADEVKQMVDNGDIYLNDYDSKVESVTPA